MRKLHVIRDNVHYKKVQFTRACIRHSVNHVDTVLQRQTAVTVYFSNKQLLLFSYAQRKSRKFLQLLSPGLRCVCAHRLVPIINLPGFVLQNEANLWHSCYHGLCLHARVSLGTRRFCDVASKRRVPSVGKGVLLEDYPACSPS